MSTYGEQDNVEFPTRSPAQLFIILTTESWERTHGRSVETLVQVIVMLLAYRAELGPVIVSDRTPGT